MVRVSDGPKAGYRLLAVVLFVLALCGAAPVPWRGAAAQFATPTAFQGNPCLDGSSQATTQTADSPYYDYVILLDVSASMDGWDAAGNQNPDKIIMPAVKDSLRQYLSELQPGSMVYIIPFGNGISESNVRQFGIDEPTAPDGGLDDALAYVDGIVPTDTGTHITTSIEFALNELAALQDDDRQHIQTMLLFTDGEGNGPRDRDDQDRFIVDNLLDAIGLYRQEQPFLFVKYVSLGVEVPDAEEMERRGVDVVESVEGVPPVREVRVAIAPDQLADLEPGVAVANLLCPTSGDLGEGIEVVVNDDPAKLPADVQLAFRGEGNTLTAGGLPLTYTLANTPSSGLGPFTTYVEVKSADPEVLINPSRLPVTFTVADPTPAITLHVGEFLPETRTRGVDDGDLVSTLPLNLAAPDGGAVALSLDAAALADMAPGATVSFVAGSEDFGETATLSTEQPSVDLRLTVPAPDIDALADGIHTLPVGVIAMPQAAEVTITGADATPQPGGALGVTPGASLTLNPEPVCGVDVAPVPGQVLLEGDQSQEVVRWETTVTLTGRDGCTGTLTFNDSALQQAIPGARAAFDVNGDAPLQIDLGDTPARVVLVATAPRASALALGLGEHPHTVDLVATTIGRLAPPEGLTPNEADAYPIPVTLPLVIDDRPGVNCTIPTFEPEEIIADGSQEPAIERSDEVSCAFAGDVSVTLRVASQDDGVSARLSTVDSAPGRTVTLDQDHPSATLRLALDRSVPQAAGEGTHTYSAQIEAQVSSRDATLELDSQPAEPGRAVSGNAALQVRVVGEKVISIAPFELTPDPLEVSTFDNEQEQLEWRGEIDVNLSNGADGTLQFELPAGSPVSAFFEVGGTTLSNPVQLAGQSGPLALVVQVPLATATAFPPGRQPFDISLTLDPQGARVEAPDFALDGELYRDTARVSLLVTSPPVAEVGSITLPPTTASTSEDADDAVRLESDPLSYDLQNGAKAHLEVDAAALEAAFPGASAGFAVGSADPQTRVTLERNGEPVILVILIPRDALAGEGPQSAPAVVLTIKDEGEDTILTRNGTPVPDASIEPDVINPDLTVTVPRVTLDPGTWQPEVVYVPINGSGTGDVTWERTFTLSNRDEGANPGVSLAADSPMLMVRLYEGDVSEDTLLAEGMPGRPATTVFQPGHDRIVAVVSAPEAQLRELGLSTSPPFPGMGASERHTLPVAVTIDPRGSKVTAPSAPDLHEPDTQHMPVTAEVIEPRNNLIYGIPVLLLLLLATAWALLPVLPKDAAVQVEGDADPIPISSGTMIGPGMTIDVGSNGVFGTIRGTVGGRITGNARFIAGDIPITYQDEPIEAGKSQVIHRDDELTDSDSNTRITYTRAEEPTVFDDGGYGPDDGN